MVDKNVQTTLDKRTYDGLARLARARGTSIKALTREAVETYLIRETPLEDDPIWDFIGSGDLPPGNWSERKDWRDPWPEDLH